MARQPRTRPVGKYAEKNKRTVNCMICSTPTKDYIAKRLENSKVILIGKECCLTNGN